MKQFILTPKRSYKSNKFVHFVYFDYKERERRRKSLSTSGEFKSNKKVQNKLIRALKTLPYYKDKNMSQLTK